MRLRPRFLISVGCFLILITVLSFFLPEPAGVKKARIVITRVETKGIASASKERSAKIGGLTNIDNRFVFQAVFGTNSVHAERTNSQGEVLDWWKMPYQIKIESQTNFVVTSAGPNKTFGAKMTSSSTVPKMDL